MLTLKLKKSAVIDFTLLLIIFVVGAKDSILVFMPSFPMKYFILAAFAYVLLLGINKFNKGYAFFLAGAVLLVGLSYLFAITGMQRQYIKSLAFNIHQLANVLIISVAITKASNIKEFCNKLCWMSYLVVLLLIAAVATGTYIADGRDFSNYVGVGVGSLIYIGLIIQRSFRDKRYRIIDAVFSAIFIGFVTIYGNRGAVVALLAFVVFCFIKYTSFDKKIVVVLLLIVLGIVISRYYNEIVVAAINISDKFGIESRMLRLLLNGNISSTTHRTDEIWPLIMQQIRKNWVLGCGLAYDRVLGGAINVYAHNLVLELILSFGCIFGVIALLFHGYVGYRMIKVSSDWENVFMPIYVTSTVLLMFNSSFLILPSFWVIYSVFFDSLRREKAKHTRMLEEHL